MHASHMSLLCVQDRKVIVKSLKGLVTKVCQEENGHLLMLGIFDSVDDTVLVKKVLLSVSSVCHHLAFDVTFDLPPLTLHPPRS